MSRVLPKFFATAAVLATSLGAFYWAPPSRADTIYVSNQTHSVAKFDSSGAGGIFIANTILNGGEGIALDSSHNIYVAAEDGGIRKFSPAGNDLGLFGSTGANSSPEGLAFDGSGNLYVADYFNNAQVFKFTPGGASSPFGNTGTHRTGVTFDTSGNLYVADNSANNITKITPGGVASVFTTTGLSGPAGVAFDSSGNLFVANVGGKNITKYSSSGSYLGVFASTAFSPDGIAFDSTGNLYVVLNSGTNAVEKFTPAAVGSIFATTGLSSPTYIAILPDAVPEPASLGMLGLGMVGLMVRRRQRPAAI